LNQRFKNISYGIAVTLVFLCMNVYRNKENNEKKKRVEESFIQQLFKSRFKIKEMKRQYLSIANY